MKTVILGGPALALDNSIKTRHYTVIDADTGTQIASLIIDVEAKTRSLIMHTADNSEEVTAVVAGFIKTSAFAYSSIPITADDSNAVALVFMLNNNITSDNADIVALWTSYNLELEMRSSNKDGSENKIRFTGANLKGIKDIATATSITLTITANK